MSLNYNSFLQQGRHGPGSNSYDPANGISPNARAQASNPATSLHKAASSRMQPAAASFFTQSSSLRENAQESSGGHTFGAQRTTEMHHSRQSSHELRTSRLPTQPFLTSSGRTEAQTGKGLLQRAPHIATVSTPLAERETHGASLPALNPHNARYSQQPLNDIRRDRHSVDTTEVPSNHSYQPSDARSQASSEVDIGLGLMEDGEDDMSVRVLKSFADLKHAKLEIEKQRRENAHLATQIAAVKGEKDDAVNRLYRVKEAAKKAIEANSNSLASVKAKLTALEAQSRESFGFVTQARSAMSDVNDMRRTVKDSTQKLERVLGEDGSLARSAESVEIITELQMECAKSRQANDLLRDKLTDLTSQLVEARDRTRDVEASHANQTNALRVAVADLSSANSTIAAQNADMKKLQKEISDALVACLRSEDRIAGLEKSMDILRVDADGKQESMKQMHKLQHEIGELRAILEEKDNRIVTLQIMRAEVLSSMSTSNELHSELTTLRRALDEQTRISEQNHSKCTATEAECNTAQIAVHKLESELQTILAREQAAVARDQASVNLVKQLTAEKTACMQQLTTLQEELKASAEDFAEQKEKLQQAQMRCQVVQERFEDQSTTLKLIREAHGDMQERLINAEKSFSSTLEAETGKLQQNLLVIQERNSSLQTAMDELKQQVKREQELLGKTQIDYEGRLKAEQASAQAHLSTMQERMLQAEQARAALHNDVDETRGRLSATQNELNDLSNQAQLSILSTSRHEVEVNDLRSQISALQAENAQLLQKTHSITERYKVNDLTDEEKAFVDALHEESQAFHKKELADKQNELRRRGNMITGLESKVNILEKSLARHLKTQAHMKPPKPEDQSIMNLSAYANSSIPSSPPRLSQAPDSDHASPGNGNSPAIGHQAASRLISVPPVLAEQKDTLPSRAPANYRTPLPVAQRLPSPVRQTGRAIFARLATDASDDIVDFDELPAGPPHNSLGKHDRQNPTSPRSKVEDKIEDVDGGRPTRRLKANKKTEAEPKKVVVPEQITTKPRRARRGK